MKQPLNEQFRRMQKLAGLITESQGQEEDFKEDFTIGGDVARDVYRLDMDELKKEMEAVAGQYNEGADYSYTIAHGDNFPNTIVVTNSAMLDDEEIVEFLEGLEGDGEY
jgi:hypothetical protein